LLKHCHEVWTHNPAVFISMVNTQFIYQPNPGIHPMAYIASQCLGLDKQGALATMVRRCYCVLFSRIQKESRLPLGQLAALMESAQLVAMMGSGQPGTCSLDQLERMLSDGSRLECWINDVCTGAIFYMGRELGDYLYACSPP
jgi:hypothetical protein